MTMLMLLISGLAFGQTNSFSIRVADGTPGKVDAGNVDVAGYTATDKILVEIVVDSLDFVLAGFELRLDFLSPTLAMEDSDAAFQDGDAPLKAGSAWGAAPLVLLPSDSSSNQTAATVNNSFGTFRFGALVTDPVQRPSGDGTSEYVVATVEIGLKDTVGTDCRTNATKITAFMCTAGAVNPDCDIFASDSAERTALNYSGVPTIIVQDTSVSKEKGDFDDSGSNDILDVLACIGCIAQTSPCAFVYADNLQQSDFNCSGGADILDALSLINYISQTTSRSVGKKGNLEPVAGEGTFVVDNSGLEGAGFVYDIKVDGPVSFKPVSTSDNDWYVSGNYHADTGVYKLIAVNLKGGDVAVPSVEIQYTAGKDASMGVLHSAYYTGNAKETNRRGATHNTGAVSSRDRFDDDKVKN
jgi:hypothetical protein